MKRIALVHLAALAFTYLGFGASTPTKVVDWSLPADWERGVKYDVRSDGYVDIYGGELSRRYGLGAVGEPDLPTMTVNVGVPTGGSFVSAELTEVEWRPVEGIGKGLLPLPIAEPVQFGAELKYPSPEQGAYEGSYPAKFAVAGQRTVSGGVVLVPVTVTPFRWDGATKTLYRAARMGVRITLRAGSGLTTSASGATTRGGSTNQNSARVRALARIVNPADVSADARPQLTTSSAGDGQGEIIIVSPSEFVSLWEGYAAFRKTTDAGRNFKYTVKNTADIYSDPKYWTTQCDKTKSVARSDNADALAIHHYLEDVYDPDREQYIILGAAPAKYSYDRATMIPARYVINQNSYDQVCDMYYGCMDRIDANGKVVTDDTAEVWDYNLDGWYMGSKNAGGGYTGDNNSRVDWDMDVPVARVPLMREVAETKDGHVYHMNAAQIMDNFTNRIAYAENPATWTSDKRWRHVLGGGYLFNNYNRGSKDYLVRGERLFFDGGVNHFDAAHQSPAPDAEACPRARNYEYYTSYRAARHGLINTGGLKTTQWADLYRNSGDLFDVYCHGWARGADPGTTGGALFSTGLWRVYNMAVPCESGMYDYCPSGSYGITNCVCMGEAPLLCFGTDPSNPKNVGGGLVTFDNSRYGWWGGFNSMSSRMEMLINEAFYRHEMNAGQACVFMHNNSGMKTTGSRGGASNIEVILHGDPLTRISPQLDRNLTGSDTEWNVETVDYTKNLHFDTTETDGDVAVDVTGEDLAAARLKVGGSEGQTVVLGGEGMFRTTDSTVVTNANLTWNVAGGAGRNGIQFVGRRGDLTFEGKASRYIGYKVLNAGNVAVNGGNVTLDFDHGQTESSVFTVDRLAFGGRDLDPTAYNVIRTRAQAFFAATRTIPVVNNCVELQTWNIGGGTSELRDRPLFFLTNSFLKVTYNPYWETEYFVRPTHLTDSRIVGEYANFGFGRPEGYGYDLYVWGSSRIEGSVPIKLTGELRVHLMTANSVLEITNPLGDGHGGMAGSIRAMGSGTLRIAGPTTFSGGVTVESGATLELAAAKTLSCDVNVEDGGTLRLAVIPLEDVKTITMEGDSRLILPYSTGSGIYQIIDSSTSSLVLKEGVEVYDAADLSTPLVGRLSEGCFLLTAKLIYWQQAAGTWKDDAGATECWRDAQDDPIGFTNSMPVVFGDIGTAQEVTVTVDGEVKPGFVNFENASCRYVFDGSGTLSLESLASGYDVTLGVDLALNNVLKVLGGRMSAVNVQASQIDVSGGRLHVSGSVTEPMKMVRTIKFMFSATQRDGERSAIQELRLFRGTDFVKLPVGTLIEDIAGQKIKIVAGGTDWSNAYEWVAGKPNNEDESLKALIDGKLSGNNKWWASKSSSPTWFTITFPEPQEPITGYSMRTADANYRNPKSWSVWTSPSTDNLTQAAAVEDFAFDKAGSWMGTGGGTAPDFAVQSVDGALIVHSGGTLFAAGQVAMNLRFETGSTLAVTNAAALTKSAENAVLTLPEADGSVLVDASQAMVTSEAFPILVGYQLTAEDFLKFRCVSEGAVINLDGGNLYVVTDGIRKDPYSATVSETAGSLAWSGLDWRDGMASSFTWDASVNYRTDGAATIGLDWVDGMATALELDVAGAIGSLTVNGRASDPVTLRWTASLVPRLLDFRQYAGPITLDYGGHALGYSDIYAGTDTVIPSASSGTLTVEAGKRAIVPGWGNWAKVTGEGTVAVRLGNRSDEVSATWGNEVALTGTLELLRGTWKIDNVNDYPKSKEVLIGAEGVLAFSEVVDTSGYKVCPTGLTVADGGEVRFGKRDTFNRKLTLRNGGKVLMTGDATDSNRALDIYESATIVAEGSAPSWFGGTDAERDAETGDPIVKSGVIALRRPQNLTVTVREGATLRMFSQWGGAAGTTYTWAKDGAGLMEFYRASEQTGTMTIQEGTVRFVNKGRGTSGTVVNQGELQLLASNGYEQVVANEIRGTGGVTKLGPGTTVLTGVNTYRGVTTVEEGTLRIGSADALGASSVMMHGGVLDMGALRIPDSTVDATREAAFAQAFSIRAELTTQESFGQVQLVKLGSFAEYLSGGELKNLFVIVVNGVELKPEEFKIVVSGGIAEYQPDELEGFNYPLETTVATSNDWAAFEWRDQSGVAFTNDWSEYPNATVVVNVEPGGNGRMTFAHGVTTPRLTVNNRGGYLEIGGGAATLHATGMIDATGSAAGSVTFLNFDLGACNIDTGAGETILLPGCSGTLNTDRGSLVTVTNGTGRGTAVLAEESELRFMGTEGLTTLPWCSIDNRSGAWIGFGLPITVEEAAFGGVGDNPGRTDGNFHLHGNLRLVTERFVTGNGTGTVENFRQTGGAVEVTGNGDGETTTTTTVLLGHWPSTIAWEQSGGTFTATNAPTVLGWDGKVTWNQTGGTTRMRGLWANRRSYHDNTSSYTLAGGRLEIGDLGLIFTNRVDCNASLTLAGGTLEAYADSLVAVERGITVTADSTFAATAGSTLTIDATIAGTGVLTAEGDGTVRYAGDCSEARLVGRFQIVIGEAQRMGATSTALFTLPDGETVPAVTIVDEHGEAAVGGNGKVANGKYHWVPSGRYVQPISTTLNGGTVLSYATVWHDAAGTEIGFQQITSDMDIVFNVAADTTWKNYDQKTMGTVTFTGGHTLTLQSEAMMSYAVANAQVLTDVVLADTSFTFAKVAALPDGVSLAVGSADAIGSFGEGPFDGTLVCDGFLPTWAVLTSEAQWRGTVVLKSDQKLKGEDKFFANYGNSRSTVVLAGTFDGYLKQAGSTTTGLRIDGTLKFSNGYSNNGGFVFSGPLSGSGTIQTSGNPTDVLAFTGDAAAFRGAVEVKGGHCVSFGAQPDDGSCEGKIAVLSATPVIASDRTWSAVNGIVVQDGGVLSVEFHDGTAWAAASPVTVVSGATLNLVRENSMQREFRISSSSLSLGGRLTLNGVPVPSWGYTRQGGVITLAEKAVCVSPVRATVDGRQNLTALTFTDSAATPNAFTPEELRAVPELELAFTMAAGAELVVDDNLNAAAFRFLGTDRRAYVIGSTGTSSVYAGTDTVFDTAGAGMLVIASGCKATAPSWDTALVDLQPAGWLTFTGSGDVSLPDYMVANATLELAGDHKLAGSVNRVVANSTLVSSGTLTTGSHENGLKPGATLNVTAGRLTLDHRFIMSQGLAGTARMNQTGGEVVSGESSGNLYVGGYENSRLELYVTGGRFAAAYAPYDGNGVTVCYGTVVVTGEGVFAPRIITCCTLDCRLAAVADVTVSDYRHNLLLADGGTFVTPAVVPNWFATAVTNGTARMASQDTTLAKGPLSVGKDCRLLLTEGTLRLATEVAGDGELSLESGATLDLNGRTVYNVTGCGTVTNSGASAQLVYTTSFETNLTFECDVRLENPYVDVAEAVPEIRLITRGSGVITALNGVRVRVNGKLDRRTWKLTADRKGIEVSVPYSAFLTKSTAWNNGEGDGLAGHLKFQNDKAYSIVISNSADNATLTFDTDARASVFKLVSEPGRAATLARDGATVLDFDAYDLSEARGRAVLAFDPGDLLVTAGSDSRFPVGGSGRLAIPAGATATVGADFAGYANEGTLRRDFDCGSRDYASFLQGNAASTNSFRSVTFTGGMQAAKAVIRVLDGDLVTLKGTSGNYGARTQASFDVQGGKLRLEANQADTWYGANGTTSFRQSGGVFEVTANNHSQNGNVGFMVGYANTSASFIPFDITGGAFLVENTSINFYDPSVVTLGGTGRMRAKGVFKAKSYATMTIADSARFELGQLGWRQNSANLTMNGGMLTTFEDATMENAVTLGGDAAIGAAADTTLTLNANVSGPHTLTVGATVSNDTGKVVTTGSRLQCGRLVLAAGTLELPVGDPLAVDIGFAGGTLNLTGLEGAAEYAVTTGSISGEPSITFNGMSLADANLRLEGNRLVTTIAVQPFHLDLAAALDTSWTNAPWRGANGVAVAPEQWSLVCVATVSVADGVEAVLTVDSPVLIEQLKIASRGTLKVRLADPDFSIGSVDDTGSTSAATFEVVGQDGVAWPASKFGFGTNRLVVACGTRFSPFTVDTAEKLLESREIVIAEGATLRMHELATGSGNSVWTIAGVGADKSTLIMAVERGLGFNAGSNFTNLTLVVDAVTAGKKTYLEQRKDGEILTDASVDLVITNGSVVSVQGTYGYPTVVNVGDLSGDGTIDGGTLNNGKLGVNLRSDSTFDGSCSIPLVVSGGHTLTLTGNGTGAIEAAADTTVRFDLRESSSPASLSGSGRYELAAGVLHLASAAAQSDLVIGPKARIDLLADAGDEFVITTGALTLSEGLAVTNLVTVRGAPLQGTWTLNGGTIVRTRAAEPFELAVSADLAGDFTAAPWFGANGIAVAADEWDRSLSGVVVDMIGGNDARLTVDRALSIAKLTATNGGVLALSPSAGFTLANSTVLEIAAGSTVRVPGWKASNVTGRGVLALDSGNRDTEVSVSGAFGTDRYYGGIRLERGTWNLTGNYPQWFWLSAVGQDSVLRFNAQDLTGYGYNFPDLEIADGATLRISKRDTFDRKLILRNGAKMIFDADNLNSGRAFDFFSRSSLQVCGSATCTIGGETDNLGIVSIRRQNFTITVDDDATLALHAKLTASGEATGNLIKAGGGLLECFRESDASVPLAVNGGSVRYIGAGSACASNVSLADGTTLEFVLSEGAERTFAKVVSGDGSLVKSGSGTLGLTAANTHAGGTLVQGGTLLVGNANALGTGILTVAAGAIADFGSLREVAQPFNPDSEGTYRFTLSAAETNSTELVRLLACDMSAVPTDRIVLVYPDGQPCGSVVLVDGYLAYRSPKVDVVYPVIASEPTDADWQQVDWHEADGSKWTRGWSAKVEDVRIELSDGATTLTTAEPISVGRLVLANGGDLTIRTTGAATVSATAISDLGSTGTTTLGFDTGAASVVAGADTVLTHVGSGQLTIGEGAMATVPGVWSAISLASGGVVRYVGEYDTLPLVTDTTAIAGTVIFAGTIANADVLSFGNARKELVLADGCDITANRMLLGNNGQTSQHITQTGGRLTLNASGSAAGNTGNNDTPLLLSHWPGNDRSFRIEGGETFVTNGVVRLGWDGGITLSVGGGDSSARLRAMGIRGGTERTNKGSFELALLPRGRLELGAAGISMLNSDLASLRLAGGEIRAYADCSVDCGTGLTLAADSVLSAESGVTLAVPCAVSGTGLLTIGSADAAGEVSLTGEIGCERLAIAAGASLQLSTAEEESSFVVAGPGTLRIRLTVEQAECLDDFTTNLRVDSEQAPSLALVDSTGATIENHVAFVADGVVRVRMAEGYEKLWWNNSESCWTNAAGVVRAVTVDSILIAQDGDVIDYSTAVTPSILSLPERGTVTIGRHWNLGSLGVSVPAELTLTLPGTTAATMTFSGEGTIALDCGSPSAYTIGLPVTDANLAADFSGGLRLLAGQFKATAAIRSSVSITVDDGAQLFASTGEWNNRFVLRGNGWDNKEGAWDRAALRIEGSIGASAVIEFEKVGGIVPAIGCYSGTRDIAGTLVGTDGCRLSSGGGTLRFTAPKTQAKDLHGTVTLEGGNAQLGINNGGFAKGDAISFGDEFVVASGRTLTLHAWTTVSADYTVANKVLLATPVTLAGGTLKSEDGSYAFSRVTVSGTSTMTVQWQKGWLFRELNIPSDATLNLTITGSDNRLSYIGVDAGVCEGTFRITNNGSNGNANTRFSPLGTVFADGTLAFAGNRSSFIELRDDATLGVITGVSSVFGDGSPRTLTLTAGTHAEVFKDQASGTPSAAKALSLVIDGDVTLSTASTYSGSTTVVGGMLTTTRDTLASDLVFAGGKLDLVLNGELATNVVTTGSVTLPTDTTLRDVMLVDGVALDAGWQISADNTSIYRYSYGSISVNIAGGDTTAGQSPDAYLVTGSASVGLIAVPGYAWNNINGKWGSASTHTIEPGNVNAYDGANSIVLAGVGVEVSAANTYHWNSAQTTFFKGYLDDSGDHAQVKVTGLDYDRYDVIVYSTSDTAGRQLSPVTVNGTSYTFAGGAVVPGATAWGASQASVPAYGTNALRVRNLTGSTLTIVGSTGPSGARGGIAAIQIVNVSRPHVDPQYFKATISGSATFGEIDWTPPLVEGEVNEATLRIDDTSTDEVVLTFDDPDLDLGKLDIVSSRDVWLDSPTPLSRVVDLVLTNIAGRLTYGWPMAITLGDDKVAYAGGAGTAASPVTYMTGSGSHVILRGGEYHFAAGQWTGNQTDVSFTNSTVTYASNFGIGKATYHIGGDSTVTTPSLWLAHGQNNRDASLTLGGTSKLSVTGTSSADASNTSTVFGSYAGSSTFTLNDAASFVSAADVLVGKSGRNHTINLNGGTFTARGIRVSAGATGVNALNLNGGRLVLGTTGIDAYGSAQLNVVVSGTTTLAALDAWPLAITQPLSATGDGKLVVDVTGATLKSGDLLIAWSAANTVPFEAVGLDESLKLEVRDDGLAVVTAAVPGVVPAEQGTSSEPVGEGENAVITITPNPGVTSLDVNAPDGYAGKYEIPVSVTNITGVSIGQLIIRSGDFDIAAACRLDGTAIVLDPTVATPRPTEAGGTIEPFVVVEGSAALGVKTIPGLTYQLIRGTAVDAVDTPLETEGARVFATEAATELSDTEKPVGKAFYKVRVMK